jgi:hypothetical protein
MIRRVVRTIVFAGTLIALWLIAAPAFASSAPLCDDRGATGVAPAPALQAPEDIIARAMSPTPDCLGGGASSELAITASHDAPAPPDADGGFALPVRASHLPLPVSTVRSPASVVGDARDGTFARIERPPRA